MTMLGSGSSVLILDDNDFDLDLARVCFEKAGYENDLMLINDPKTLFEYMGMVEKGIKPFPEVLILDINMPAMDGFDVLRDIRKKPSFQNFPVAIFLTHSSSFEDQETAKALNCIAFWTKPQSIQGFVDLYSSLSNLIKDK